MKLRLAPALAVFVATACTSATVVTPSNVASESPAPSSSQQASLSPIATPSATPPVLGGGQFGNWTVAEALVEGLRVRVAPGLDAEPVLLPVADARVEYRLALGEYVLVTGGGASRDGYTWWEVFGSFRESVVSASPVIPFHGYVAGGPADDPWLQEVGDLGCPHTPTVTELAALVPFMRLACYDSAPLTFEAYAWTYPEDAGLGGACDVAPEREDVRWLLCDHINYNWVNATGNSDWTFQLHFNPALLPAPNSFDVQGQHFTITGHFDDPASELCAEGRDDPDARSVAFWECSMLFVVERLEP